MNPPLYEDVVFDEPDNTDLFNKYTEFRLLEHMTINIVTDMYKFRPNKFIRMTDGPIVISSLVHKIKLITKQLRKICKSVRTFESDSEPSFSHVIKAIYAELSTVEFFEKICIIITHRRDCRICEAPVNNFIFIVIPLNKNARLGGYYKTIYVKKNAFKCVSDIERIIYQKITNAIRFHYPSNECCALL